MWTKGTRTKEDQSYMWFAVGPISVNLGKEILWKSEYLVFHAAKLMYATPYNTHVGEDTICRSRARKDSSLQRHNE
ncbi:hypothetical protein T4E_1525 [Trichinella pseudospiralis]|uniref:Uncharacterized protein n=1 Tax=Trichinella pseudospiralis TaxID=6337 RepID=A0A0V0XT17_TRIPS|nr:hypothetical protein T4E_1525 [Trichinella pseudospiralis]